jgi:ferrochelatase
MIGEYGRRAEAGLGGRARFELVTSWATEPAYVTLLGDGVCAGLAQLPAGSDVVFTAHSLPLRALVDGDPYLDELGATAQAVADAAGLERFHIAWQSAGRTDDAWLGPDVLELMGDLARGGSPGVLVCPAGFVADHLEVLYDLDVEAAGTARELGLAFARTPSPNAGPRLVAALADAVEARLAVRA